MTLRGGPRWMFRLDMPVQQQANHRGAGKRWGAARERAAIRERIRDAIGRRLETLAAGDGGQDWIIHLVRVSPGALDSDNLPYAFKTHRDAIAKHLGRDDRHGTGLYWTYDQRREGKGVYALEVVLVLDPPRCPTCGQHKPVKATEKEDER